MHAERAWWESAVGCASCLALTVAVCNVHALLHEPSTAESSVIELMTGFACSAVMMARYTQQVDEQNIHAKGKS